MTPPKSDVPPTLGITPEMREKLDREIEEAEKTLPSRPKPPELPPAPVTEEKQPSAFYAKVQEHLAADNMVEGVTLRSIALSEIVVGDKRRAINEGTVVELMDSIRENGLFHPIIVTLAKRLVAGLHRKVAFERLGLDEIPCIVKGYDVLHAELAEIDENLVRAELNALERGEYTARRKRVYLALHPETGQGKAPGAGRGKGKKKGETPSFIDDAASKTGKDQTTIIRDARIGEKISQDVRDKLRDHEVAGSKTELLKLAKLKTNERQREVARLIKSGEVKNVTDALRVLRLRDRHDRNAATSTGNEELDAGGRRFGIIYADPAWKYEHSISVSRDIEEKYPTMELEAICDMPVEDVSADDAVLFLWCPPSLIRQGLQVMERWSFEFRTHMVWDKEKLGMGYFVRQRHEDLLIGVRGNPPTPETTNRPESVIRSPRGKHSEKPDEVAAIIEKMYPKWDRLELFARKKRKNWTCWGNEVKSEAA